MKFNKVKLNRLVIMTVLAICVIIVGQMNENLGAIVCIAYLLTSVLYK